MQYNFVSGQQKDVLKPSKMRCKIKTSKFLENKMIKITKTLTKDRNKKTVIGSTKTKSGKRNIEINQDKDMKKFKKVLK